MFEMTSYDTMFIHYDKLYRNYVNNLNKVLAKYPFKFNSIQEVIDNIDKFDEKDRNNILFFAGGVLNHELYFENLSKNNNKPSGKLLNAINNKYGSYENFKQQFRKKALELKGSGFVFLVSDKDGNIDIMLLSNQDNPYMYNLIPLLNLDMWEHSYFLDYQNRKDEYIDNFFKIISFDKVNEKYEEII